MGLTNGYDDNAATLANMQLALESWRAAQEAERIRLGFASLDEMAAYKDAEWFGYCEPWGLDPSTGEPRDD